MINFNIEILMVLAHTLCKKNNNLILIDFNLNISSPKNGKKKKQCKLYNIF